MQMRDEALAKSYRPLNALFSPANRFRLVGGGSIGEMFLSVHAGCTGPFGLPD